MLGREARRKRAQQGVRDQRRLLRARGLQSSANQSAKVAGSRRATGSDSPKPGNVGNDEAVAVEKA